MKCREELEKIQIEINNLTQEKDGLLWKDGQNLLDMFNQVIEYYETWAPEEESRSSFHKEALEKFKAMKEHCTTRIGEIDAEIPKLQSRKQEIWDSPNFQKLNPYELRCLVMDDGHGNEKLVYSYIKYNNRWWKVRDNEVTETNESQVITDRTGIYMNAGALMVIYSRKREYETEECEVPDLLKNAVLRDNIKFAEEVNNPIITNNWGLNPIPPDLAGIFTNEVDNLLGVD